MIKLNGVQIIPTIFPDGTSQIWMIDENLITNAFNTVEWDFTHEGEIIHLAQLKDLLDSFRKNRHIMRFELFMPFLPYARQDKPISNTTTFSLLSFAKLINAMEFDLVHSLDAHSNVANLVIKNFFSLSPISMIEKICRQQLRPDLVCYPDKGARDRYSGFHKVNIYGEKVRDQLTGHISHYELIGECKDKNVLIIDDICDGGATFIKLAQALHKAGAKEVHLFVTHGIFSKGLRVLKDAGISRIFTRLGEASEVQSNIVYKEF